MFCFRQNVFFVYLKENLGYFSNLIIKKLNVNMQEKGEINTW